jgi:HlyD family secretion protein
MRIIRGRLFWIGGGVLILTLAAVWGLIAVKQSLSSRPPLKTVSLQRGEMVLSVPATGVVEPAFSVEIKSKASGEILHVRAEEGNRVEKGDVLVEIDPRIEEIGVRRAKADLLVAEAGVKRAEILLEKAQLIRSRKDQLYQKGFLSDQEKEDAHQEEGLRGADLALAHAQLLKAQEAISEAKERLQQTQVISPIAGVLLSLLVQRGQIISSGTSSFSQGTPLAVVGDISLLQIRAEVDETDVRMVAPGQEARVNLDAFPGQIFHARVVRVAPQARIKNDLAVVDLHLTIKETPEATSLRPGLSANIEILINRLSDVLLLPREGVHQEGGKWGISVIQGEKVSFHEVTVGATDGVKMEIVTDLPEGTRVALEGTGADRPMGRGERREIP